MTYCYYIVDGMEFSSTITIMHSCWCHGFLILIVGFQLRTLYVKNLHFGTTDEKLGKYFREKVNEGKILSARVSILDSPTFDLILVVVCLFRLLVVFRL